MHVAVVLRIVPDLSEDLEIAEDGNDIDREWVGLKLNEFDDHALEEAILVKEANGARVTAVVLAGDGAERQLQNAIARGADDGLIVQHSFEGPVRSREAALLLRSVILSLGADVVMTGVQTPEDIFGQLAPFVAATLDWPTINAVNGISIEGESLVINQEYSGGYSARFVADRPIVLGIQTASKPPRYVSGTKLREASSVVLQKMGARVPDGFVQQQVGMLSHPIRGEGAELLSGSAEEVAEKIVHILSDRGLLGAKQ